MEILLHNHNVNDKYQSTAKKEKKRRKRFQYKTSSTAAADCSVNLMQQGLADTIAIAGHFPGCIAQIPTWAD